MIDPETNSMFFLLVRVFTIKLIFFSNFILFHQITNSYCFKSKYFKDYFHQKYFLIFMNRFQVVKQKQKTSNNNNKKSR